MSNYTKAGSPLTFKAGGKGRRSSDKANESIKNKNSSSGYPVESPRTRPSPSSRHPTTESNALTVVQTGLLNKRSPFQIKNWIACVLTLDGRDKFTKVLQYASRLLAWYFAGLAKQTGSGTGGAPGAVGSNMATSATFLSAVIANGHLRQQLYSALSQRFSALYKSLVTSRKAFRLGRSVIELDKIKSMGWGGYLGYMMTHPLAGGAADDIGAKEGNAEKELSEKSGGMGTMIASHTLDRYDTHPIPEEEGSHDENWSEDSVDDNDDDDDDDDSLLNEEKKLDTPYPKKVKVVTRPGRPKLPSRISSNIGWGPSTTSSKATSTVTKKTSSSNPSSSKRPHVNQPPARTVSEMGRGMYQPFPSRSSSMGSYKQAKEPSSSLTASPSSTTVTPPWKLIGGTIKLLGLMGFWAFDNLSFLTGTGFLDPIQLHPISDATADAKNDHGEHRLNRKKRLSILAGRCYFFGVIAGLYVNARAFWGHRSGSLSDARDRLDEALRSSTDAASSDSEGTVEEARSRLKQTEGKHFELSLALLKSCCDFLVFSNNPGIDLHLKFRGRKNHEGLHCLGGLVSASTVLYNNFPNAK